MPLKFLLRCVGRQTSQEKFSGAPTQKGPQYPSDNLNKNGVIGSNGVQDNADGNSNDTSRIRQEQRVESMENNVIVSSNEVIHKVEEPISSTETSERRSSITTDWTSCFIDLKNSMNGEDEEKLKFLCGSYLTSEERRGSVLYIFKSIHSRSKDDSITVEMIREIMFHIRRYDVLRNILCASKEEYKSRKFSEFIWDPLRVLLLQINDDLGDDELSDLHIFFFNSKLDADDCSYEDDCYEFGDLRLFERLMQEKLVSKTNLGNLKRYMEEMGRRDITRKIDNFSNDLNLQEPSLSGEDEVNLPTSSHNLHYEEPSHFGDRNPEPPAKNEPYLMRESTKRRGFCFIINNKKFKSKHRFRRGSERDKNRLTKILENLNFNVVTYSDLSRKKMVKVLNYLGSRNFEDYDILLAFVMSHGKKDCILSVDGKKVPISDIKGAFSPSQCPTFKEKPKLFFIQACQGKQMSIAKSNDKFPKSKPIIASNDGQDNGEDLAIDRQVEVDGSIPAEADFLTAIATVEDYVSYRNIENGSWFIQSFCDVLQKSAKTETISDMMLKVNYAVGEREGRLWPESQSVWKQMPEFRFTLRGPCYLTYEAYEAAQRSKRVVQCDLK